MSGVDFLLSAAERPLPLRMRPDLVVRPIESEGAGMWVVKDPVALRYHRLGAKEWRLLQLLDGRTSLREIQTQLHRQFTPLRITHTQLQSLLARLHRDGLVTSDSPAQFSVLWDRLSKARSKQGLLRRIAANPLAVRFQGVDPEPFLRAMSPWVGWLFAPASVAVGLMFVATMAILALSRLDELLGRLPTASQFLRLENLPLVLLAMAAAKVLHELGHGLACKRQGGECHEIGVMLLILTPCLYCDVSDSWMLASRWRRAAVAAAGVYVELLLAAICSLIWWTARPGLLSDMCLNMMVVCSLGTVLFNANPLLRYDGYFVLSDLWGVPNLRQRSRQVLKQFFARHWLGAVEDTTLPTPRRHRLLLGIYALASSLYSAVVVVIILWALHQTLRPYGLDAAAEVIAGLFAFSLLASWTKATWTIWENPMRRQRIRPARLAAICGGVLIALAAVATIPAPYRIHAPAALAPEEAHVVYAAAAGRLTETIEPGTSVHAGDVLARLKSLETELEIARLAARQKELEQRIEQISIRRKEDVADTEETAALPVLRATVQDVANRLKARQDEQKRLAIVAPADGIVVWPPKRQHDEGPSEHLPMWTGAPLDEGNLGCWLEPGTPLCLIDNPDSRRALLMIDQRYAALLAEGQQVELRLDQAPSHTLHGVIETLGDWNAQDEDDASIVDWLPSPESSDFQPGRWARVRLEEMPRGVLAGARGSSRIVVAPQSLGRRLWRWTARTFRFSG